MNELDNIKNDLKDITTRVEGIEERYQDLINELDRAINAMRVNFENTHQSFKTIKEVIFEGKCKNNYEYNENKKDCLDY